jgi:hypothetical protein
LELAGSFLFSKLGSAFLFHPPPLPVKNPFIFRYYFNNLKAVSFLVTLFSYFAHISPQQLVAFPHLPLFPTGFCGWEVFNAPTLIYSFIT